MHLEREKEKGIRLLRKLGEAHGVSGCEDAVRRIFQEELGEGVSNDRAGNVFFEAKGTCDAPRVMVTAHMDEVGMMVQAVTRSGFLKVMPLGGWWPHTILAQRVRVRTRSGEEIIGVVGAKPPHLLAEGERDKVMKIEDMFVDVGATSADEVRERLGIRLGDTIAPDSSFTRMHNPDVLLCKAFDNRTGMALTTHLLQLLKEVSHPNTVCGVGTVQEEVGTRGAQAAVHTATPDVAIVLEGPPADDLPGTPEDERQGVMGRGPQIRLMDPSAITNRKLAQFAIDLAERENIAHQVAVRRSGSTDARPVHLHAGGVPSIVLGCPARYIHSHNSMIHIDDYLRSLELALKLIQALDKETVEGFTAFLE